MASVPHGGSLVAILLTVAWAPAFLVRLLLEILVKYSHLLSVEDDSDGPVSWHACGRNYSDTCILVHVHVNACVYFMLHQAARWLMSASLNLYWSLLYYVYVPIDVTCIEIKHILRVYWRYALLKNIVATYISPDDKNTGDVRISKLQYSWLCIN